MRDKLLVSSPNNNNKLLFAYAGEQALLVDTTTSSLHALPTPPFPSTTTTTTTTTTDTTTTPSPHAPPAQVEALALSMNGNKAAAMYRNKVLALWDITHTDTPTLLAHRILSKKAFALVFAEIKGEEVIIVSDKVGDVRAYPACAEGLGKKSAFLLGHTASVGTCMALSPDGKVLATGDRDEKVRLSHFPCTLVVQGYLTGHENFVTTVEFLHGVGGGNGEGSKVLTASADGTLALWDAETGEEEKKEAIKVVYGEGQEGQEQEEDNDATTARKEEENSSTSNAGAEKEKDTNSGLPVPVGLAISPDNSLVVVTILGLPQLLVYSLPTLNLIQTISTPSPPLGAKFVGALLHVTVGAPEYFLTYSHTSTDTPLALQDDGAIAALVRKYAVEKGIKTDLAMDEEEGGGFGGMTKENLQLRFEWNSRARKEELEERLREKKRRKRLQQQVGEGGEGGEVVEGKVEEEGN